MKSIYSIKKAISRKLSFFKRRSYRKYGRNSLIYKPLCVIGKKHISIGNNVSIGEFARIETIEDWGNQKLAPNLIIGDNTSFEQYAKIICTSNLTIGNNCVFSYNVFVSTAEHSYNNIENSVMEQELISRDVSIGDNCFVGMDVKIFAGVKISNNVIVGANSIVMSDLPSYTVCVGTPAKPIKKYNFTTQNWEEYK